MQILAALLVLPSFFSALETGKKWQQTPIYIKISGATYNVDNALKPSIAYSWKETSDIVYVSSTQETKAAPLFRYFKTRGFSIDCYSGDYCGPNLLKNNGRSGEARSVEFLDDREKSYVVQDIERKESYDSNFDHSSNFIKSFDGTEVEFSLISKEPLYFGSYIAVVCGPNAKGAYYIPRMCNFETLKTETGPMYNEVYVPTLKFLLSSGDVEPLNSTVYNPELWPEIVKWFESVIRESQISSIDAKEIKVMVERNGKPYWE